MLIFLDIDGVMVPAKGWKTPDFSEDGFFMFGDEAVRALSSLISENTTIVLTSSHRAKFSIEEWKEILNRRNIHVEKLIRLPVSGPAGDRNQEIVDWFRAHQVRENFIILDDDKSLNNLPPSLKKQWVKIKPFTGLTWDDLKDINDSVQPSPKVA